MDWSMPLKDGLETTEEIKKINENIFIVILSAFDKLIDINLAFKRGANHYICKPGSSE